MKCKDFIISGTLPNGTVMRVQCERKQILSVKLTPKRNGVSNISVQEDVNYGKG